MTTTLSLSLSSFSVAKMFALRAVNAKSGQTSAGKTENSKQERKKERKKEKKREKKTDFNSASFAVACAIDSTPLGWAMLSHMSPQEASTPRTYGPEGSGSLEVDSTRLT